MAAASEDIKKYIKKTDLKASRRSTSKEDSAKGEFNEVYYTKAKEKIRGYHGFYGIMGENSCKAVRLAAGHDDARGDDTGKNQGRKRLQSIKELIYA